MVITIRSPSATTPRSISSCSASRSSCVALVRLVLEETGARRGTAHTCAARADLRRQRVDRHAESSRDIHSAVEPDCGQRGDRLDLQVVRGEQRRHGDRLVDARERAVEEVAVQRRLGVDFSASRQSAPSPRRSPPGTCRRRSRPRASPRRCRRAPRWPRRRPRRAWAPAISIIDSIIWVAVIASLLSSRAIRIMRFCSAGTAASPTSTARSPRATMMPSEAFRISSRLPIASARSILAISMRLAAGRAHQFARHVHVGRVLRERHREEVGLERDRGA